MENQTEIKLHVIGKPLMSINEAGQLKQIFEAYGIHVHEGWKVYVDMSPVDYESHVLSGGEQVIVKPEIKGN